MKLVPVLRGPYNLQDYHAPSHIEFLGRRSVLVPKLPRTFLSNLVDSRIGSVQDRISVFYKVGRDFQRWTPFLIVFGHRVEILVRYRGHSLALGYKLAQSRDPILLPKKET